MQQTLTNSASVKLACGRQEHALRPSMRSTCGALLYRLAQPASSMARVGVAAVSTTARAARADVAEAPRPSAAPSLHTLEAGPALLLSSSTAWHFTTLALGLPLTVRRWRLKAHYTTCEPRCALHLQDLQLKSPFTSDLPADPDTSNSLRQARRVPALRTLFEPAQACPPPHGAARLSVQALSWVCTCCTLPKLLPQQVYGASYSYVAPTPTGTQPYLVAASPAVAQLIGLDPGDMQRPEFAAAFSGNAPLPGGPRPFAQAYGGHQFGSVCACGTIVGHLWCCVALHAWVSHFRGCAGMPRACTPRPETRTLCITVQRVIRAWERRAMADRG